MKLKIMVKKCVSKEQIEKGRMEIGLKEDEKKQMKSDIEKNIMKWKGIRWVVKVEREVEGKKIEEEEEERRENMVKEEREEKDVEEIIEDFKGEKIIEVRIDVKDKRKEEDIEIEEVEEVKEVMNEEE